MCFLELLAITETPKMRRPSDICSHKHRVPAPACPQPRPQQQRQRASMCRVCAEPPLALPAKLLRVLLACCDLAKVPDTRVVVSSMYLRLSRCLGQLGAVHPSRIRLQQPGPPSVPADPGSLMARAIAHILRILRTALHLDLVELCIFVLHKLLQHDVSRALHPALTTQATPLFAPALSQHD